MEQVYGFLDLRQICLLPDENTEKKYEIIPTPIFANLNSFPSIMKAFPKILNTPFLHLFLDLFLPSQFKNLENNPHFCQKWSASIFSICLLISLLLKKNILHVFTFRKAFSAFGYNWNSLPLGILHEYTPQADCWTF